jgi:tetratricopeptide (TPR) repeat protein
MARFQTRSKVFASAHASVRQSLPASVPAAATPAAKVRKARPPVPSAPEPAASRLDRARVLLITILVACATLPYLNILVNGFVYDDNTQVVANPYVKSFRYLKEIFTSNVWSFAGVHASNYYRPMMTLGYLVCYKVFGLKAYGFHLASLVLHALVVCLVFALAERLTGDRVCAFVAGAFFALHPAHTESVAWIAAVNDIELTFFYLLTFMFFLALARPGGRLSKPGLAAMLGAFILALLSKEQAMTLPALATVYEHFYREDRSETTLSQKLARYGVLWLLGVAYVLYRVHFLGALAPHENLPQLTRKQIILSAITLVGRYVGKLLWPAQLCFFYVFRPSTSPFDLHVLAGLLAFFGLAAIFFVCRRSRQRDVRLASFAVLWFLATLAPVLNAHWVGEDVFTERYLYLPSVGAAWLFGLGVSKLWSRVAARPAQRRALMLTGVVVAALFAVRIVIRNRDWNNEIVLFSRTLALFPQNSIVANSLGIAYMQAGDVDAAERTWRRLLAIDPDDAGALNNLGFLEKEKHHYAEAAGLFQRAIEHDPVTGALRINLAETYQFMGRPDLAEPQLREAVALSPRNVAARNRLGQILFTEGRVGEAEEQFRASVGSQPNALAYDYLGTISLRRGAAGEAEKDFSAALSLEPDDSYAHFGLGDIYQAGGRKGEALRQYEAGLVKDPTNAQALAVVRKLRLETGN